MAKKTDPFDPSDDALDLVVVALRKLRQRMFAAYIRKEPLRDQELGFLRGLATHIDETAALLPDPTETEATAYAFAEESIAGMLDDSDDMQLIDAVSQGLEEEGDETDDEKEESRKLDRCCRAADYAAYLARGCALDSKGSPKPL